MLALAGIPGTVGFIGKFYLIRALVAGDYTWLGIAIVIGSMISLGYYLRVVATIWMRRAPDVPADRAPGQVRTPTGPLPAIAGGSPEADAGLEASGRLGAGELEPGQIAQPEVAVVAIVCAGATIFFGIIPTPLFHLVTHAGQAFAGLF